MSRFAELEAMSVQLGRDRKRRQQRQAQQHGRIASTGSGRYLMRMAESKLTKAIRKWREDARKGPQRDASLVAMPLAQLAKRRLIRQTSFIALNQVIDTLHVPTNLQSAATKIANRLEDELRFREIKANDTGYWKFLRRVHQRKGYVHFRRIVYRATETKGIAVERLWTHAQRIALGTTLLRLIERETGIIELVKRKRASKPGVMVHVEATAKTLRWLREADDKEVEYAKPFWMPAAIPPKPWHALDDGGYVSDGLGYPLSKLRPFKNKWTLKDYANYRFDEVLSSINVLQAIAWQANEDVWHVAKHLWATGNEAGGLPPSEDEPLPTKPLDIDENTKARRAYAAAKRKTIERNTAARSRRIGVIKTFKVGKEYINEPRFFMPHVLCFRGRAYCLPSFIDYQGPSLSRGLLRFAEGKELTSDVDEHWFMVGGANRFGFDKGTYAEREAWAREHERLIRDVYRDPLECRWWEEADSPWEFLAWCLEAGELFESGRKGFVTQLPVDTDGTANGLQIFGMLLRCEATCRATSVLPSERPADIYADIARNVDARIAADAKAGKAYAKRWREFCPDGIPRSATKRPVMTKPYGATQHSAASYTHEWFVEERKARGLRVTCMQGDGFNECRYLSAHIWDAINEVVIAAQGCMDYLRDMAVTMVEERKRMVWSTPTGFPVAQAYCQHESGKVTTVIGDQMMSTNYRDDIARTDRKSNVQAVSANYVHSLDAACLHKIVNLAFSRGIREIKTIHDSFGVLPPDMPVLAKTIREVFADVFSEDLLLKFHREMEAIAPGVALPEIPERGDMDVREVLNSPYFFN